MFEEDDFVPGSALQPYLFCDRQAGLIHIDRVAADHALTVEGKRLHETVDSMEPEQEGGTIIRRGVAIRSDRLGIVSKADVVEFRKPERGQLGFRIRSLRGRWVIGPVEYKRGRPKAQRADETQLCAQALCLGEEFEADIALGYLYYGRTRRRERVILDGELRIPHPESPPRGGRGLKPDRSPPVPSLCPVAPRAGIRADNIEAGPECYLAPFAPQRGLKR